MQAILLVRLDHTGDCVLTVPAVASEIRRVSPETKVDLLTSAVNARLLEGCDALSKCYVWNSPWAVPPAGSRTTPKWQYLTRSTDFVLRLFPQLAGRYDKVLFLSFSPWERIMLRLTARTRIGFEGPYTSRRHIRSLSWLTHRVPFRDDRHLLTNCLTLATAAGIPVNTDNIRPPRLTVELSQKKAAHRRLLQIAEPGLKWIGIHPGSPASFKSWPSTHFRELALRLASDSGLHVFLMASQSEFDQAGPVYRDFQAANISVITCDSLVEFAAMASCMHGFVANDGGPAHIVSALGVPLTVLFGPTDDRIYQPLGNNVRVLRNREEKLAPCQTPWRKAPQCCCQRACLSGLSVDAVADAVDASLCSSRASLMT